MLRIMKKFYYPLIILFELGSCLHASLIKCFLMILITLVLVLNLSAQTSRAWDYPIHPGTAEWKELGSFQERLKAYNIPDNFLKNMTTRDLVKTCLAYPEWLLITAFNNFQIGYEALKSVFNGFDALEKRPDAFKELIIVYENMKPEEVMNQTKKGLFTFQFTFIELLLAQKPILYSIPKADLVSLAKTTHSIFEIKCKFIDIYSSLGLSTTCLILGRLLDLSNSDAYLILKTNSPEVQKFIETGPFGPNKILLDKIVFASKEYLKQTEF